MAGLYVSSRLGGRVEERMSLRSSSARAKVSSGSALCTTSHHSEVHRRIFLEALHMHLKKQQKKKPAVTRSSHPLVWQLSL